MSLFHRFTNWTACIIDCTEPPSKIVGVNIMHVQQKRFINQRTIFKRDTMTTQQSNFYKTFHSVNWRFILWQSHLKLIIDEQWSLDAQEDRVFIAWQLYLIENWQEIIIISSLTLVFKSANTIYRGYYSGLIVKESFKMWLMWRLSPLTDVIVLNVRKKMKLIPPFLLKLKSKTN